jgi:rRNA maturation RNase YbeY
MWSESFNGCNAGAQELSLVLCDDVYMRTLNKKWRGKDSTTDVLSFEVAPDEFDSVCFWPE